MLAVNTGQAKRKSGPFHSDGEDGDVSPRKKHPLGKRVKKDKSPEGILPSPPAGAGRPWLLTTMLQESASASIPTAKTTTSRQSEVSCLPTSILVRPADLA